MRNATIKGTQDTLLMSGQIYIADSIIEGNVDFVWGNGAVYFDHCEIKVVGRKGYNVQARNAIGAMGYVFVGCNLTADPGSPGTCWRAPTRTCRWWRRWSRTSTARWGRTSIRSAG